MCFFNFPVISYCFFGGKGLNDLLLLWEYPWPGLEYNEIFSKKNLALWNVSWFDHDEYISPRIYKNILQNISISIGLSFLFSVIFYWVWEVSFIFWLLTTEQKDFLINQTIFSTYILSIVYYLLTSNYSLLASVICAIANFLIFFLCLFCIENVFKNCLLCFLNWNFTNFRMVMVS